MSFRGHVTRLLRTVRGSGTAAVEIGDFEPADTSGSYAASVVLWDALGGSTPDSWFCALAMQDSGIGGNPVAYLGIGQKGTYWAPNLKLYNSGGIQVQGIGPSSIGFTDLDPASHQVSGATEIGFNTISTRTVTATGDVSAGTVNGQTLSDTGWVALAAAAGAGTVVAPLAYRVLNGVLYMRGTLQSLPAGTYTIVATLPAGVRPPEVKTFPMTSNTTAVMTVQVNTSGTVAIWCSATTSAWSCLSSIVYPLG